MISFSPPASLASPASPACLPHKIALLPTYGTPPLRLSLQGTRHHLNNFIPELLAAISTKRLQIYQTLLKVIAHKAVSDRPGRSEPRVRKRRPKIYPLMTKPRHELRNILQSA